MKFLESTWEQHFISESQLLEEMLARGEIKPLASRLQLAIENNIIDWNRYAQWAQNEYELPLLKRGLYKDQIEEMKHTILATKQHLGEKFDPRFFASLRVVPCGVWDDVVFLMATEPLPRLIELKFNFVIVLAPPEIITILSESLAETKTLESPPAIDPSLVHSPALPTPAATSEPESGQKALKPPQLDMPLLDPMAMPQSADDADESEEKGSTKSKKVSKESSAKGSKKDDDEDSHQETPLEIPMEATVATDVDFGALLSAVVHQSETKSGAKSTSVKEHPQGSSNKTTSAQGTEQHSSSEPEGFWKQIGSEHDRMSSTARKNFDGYAVLRLVGNQTSLFKLDEELDKEGLSPKLFVFNVETNTFFRDCLQSRKTDSTSMKKLELEILDFNYLCSTPLFLGERCVGFILGFKIDKLNQNDEAALEKLKTAG